MEEYFLLTTLYMQKSLRLLSVGAALAALTLALLPVVSFSSHDIPTASAAAVDYFLKIDGVDGESTDPSHRNEIEIESFSWGVSTPRDSASGQSTGRRQYQPIIIRKRIDKSSPLLARAAAVGEHLKKGVLVARDENGNEFEMLSFFDIFVEEFKQSGDQGSHPTESLSFNYQKIEFSYTPVGADGKPGTPVVRGWDVKTAK